ncbi:MAG TPA: dihydrolipoamide acetyltransferase family protein [Planctomycetaceae bacterium]|nr:dihydrolipoamide acetyltransferase family protein [Planctomycetaceae bacterium]
MPHEIRIPRLGWSMEEGTFVGWLKPPGADVAVGEPLFELEGEKALQEIESVDAGTLYVPPDAPSPGSTIHVGALLGYLLAPGEAIPSASSPAVAPPEVVTERTLVSPGLASSPTAGPSDHPIATPRAKRVAAELGVDWNTLSGTGRDGRIRESDVRADAPAVDRSTVKPLSARRKAIADRLRLSRERTIPVTLTTVADATSLVALRDQFKSAQALVVPAYTDLVACLAARVLKRHPAMAVRWQSDYQSLIPISGDQFHIGIAVDTADGLLVPIVRDVLRKPLLQVAQESKTLVDRARTSRLTTAEMQEGVLTITNLGAYGIDAFTPIINAPEIAVLGLGAIRREPVVLPDDRIVPRQRMTLSLTFDHAAVDGAPAAAFLKDIAGAIENAAAHLLSD